MPGIPLLLTLNPKAESPLTSNLLTKSISSKKSNLMSPRVWSETSKVIILPVVKLSAGLILARWYVPTATLVILTTLASSTSFLCLHNFIALTSSRRTKYVSLSTSPFIVFPPE